VGIKIILKENGRFNRKDKAQAEAQGWDCVWQKVCSGVAAVHGRVSISGGFMYTPIKTQRGFVKPEEREVSFLKLLNKRGNKSFEGLKV
jgi:hypothetical protein